MAATCLAVKENMDPKKTPLRDYAQMVVAAPYDHEKKKRWLREGKKLLKAVAEEMNLSPSTYEIRLCRGGIAVPGDVTLHHDYFYVSLGGIPFPSSFGFARQCRGRKDYCGGRNWQVLTAWDFDKLVQLCRERYAAGQATARQASHREGAVL